MLQKLQLLPRRLYAAFPRRVLKLSIGSEAGLSRAAPRCFLKYWQTSVELILMTVFSNTRSVT
jgi:hypothetical protein